jgi:recA bacterial DNA recombination protein.
MYGQGISYEGDILDLAVAGDIVEKTGAWYSYDDMKIGQGRENSKTFLTENKEVLESITLKVKSFMGLNGETEKAES